MTEYEACYIFTSRGSSGQAPHPSKRRKTARLPESEARNEVLPFITLLRGLETPECTKVRLDSFEAAWRWKEDLIHKAFHTANLDTIKEVASFIRSDRAPQSSRKVRAGLLLAGPDDRASTDLFESIAESVNKDERAMLINLSSAQSANLKTILSYMNQEAINHNLGVDEDAIIDRSRTTGQLNYDLQILFDHVQDKAISRVVVAFQDSEAFEGKMLAELMDVVSSWNDRIPFVVLFSVATSVEGFQSKLSRAAIRNLEGTEFKVGRVSIEEIFKIINSKHSTLWLSAGLSNLILQRQKGYIQSPYAMSQTLKYAYMNHYFANPLSVVLNDDPTRVPLQEEHYEAVRNLPSFRSHVQKLIKSKDYDVVRGLLDDDENLNELILDKFSSSRKALEGLVSAVTALYRTQSSPTCKTDSAWSEIYIQAMSGELSKSTLFAEILDQAKKLPSDTMHDLLRDLAGMFHDNEIEKVIVDLGKLTSNVDDPEIPLRSQYDTDHETLRTTIVAQKVSLSKNASILSAQDAAYTRIVDRAFSELHKRFELALINPQTLFLNEALIYDSKSPHRDVFTPRPRFAIERALSSPHDYLGCGCCGRVEGGLSATQPATTILYQLYLESGSAVNAADLWSAFWTIVATEGGEDEEADREVL